MANSTIIPAVLCIKNSLPGLRKALLGKQRRELQLSAWDPVLEALETGAGLENLVQLRLARICHEHLNLASQAK